jgi:uncharacterized cupredoxin-like copper-binding protein
MRLARLAPIAAAAALAMVVTACGSGSASPAASPASSPAASAAAEPTATAQRIEVTLSDALKIEPAAMTVPAGVPVTFVVTNEGTVLHEFVLGDEEVQAEHETEMEDEGGMTMAEDEPNAIGVEPGETKELTFTFESPGTTFAGCHVVGHYGAGMKSTITVE